MDVHINGMTYPKVLRIYTYLLYIGAVLIVQLILYIETTYVTWNAGFPKQAFHKRQRTSIFRQKLGRLAIHTLAFFFREETFVKKHGFHIILDEQGCYSKMFIHLYFFLFTMYTCSFSNLMPTYMPIFIVCLNKSETCVHYSSSFLNI